jgi:formyl-CoA transferase/succinyl-CoA--D-citramalate CoA-transferase
VGALMALWSRDRPGGTGRGQVVDVALYEAMWMYMESLAAEFAKLDRTREPTGALLPGIAPSSVYPTRDGERLIIGANQDSVFRRLAAAMGRDAWVADDSPYRDHESIGLAQAELDEAIGSWTSGFDADDLLAVLSDAGVPSGRIYTARDIVGDPHYAARDMIVDVPEPGLDGETVPMPGVVPKLSATPGVLTRGAPLLGEHNQAVFGGMLPAADLEELQFDGVV